MDSPGYGIAAMRRGSYDDAAASLRPVSIDLPSRGKGEKDQDSVRITLTQFFQTHEFATHINILYVVYGAVYEGERFDCWLT